MPSHSRTGEVSLFEPLRHPVFRALWWTNGMSNIGTWMHTAAAGWVMASQSQSPLWVGLVQTATTLPLFLFAIPAGIFADLTDRRRLLLFTQVAMALTAF